MPTPSRFTSPTLAPGPKSIGTQRRPRSRGGVSVGRYWGRSPGSLRTACRWDGDGWVRCPTTGSYPHPLRPPVYQSRSACAGVVVRGLGELEANAWYSRTPYLQRRFPRARPPQGGGHDFAYRYRCVDVLFSVFQCFLRSNVLCCRHDARALRVSGRAVAVQAVPSALFGRRMSTTERSEVWA